MKSAILVFFIMQLACGTLLCQEKRTFEYTEGDTTYVMKKYIFGLYKAGPNREQDSIEVAAIQKGHLAHISAMSASGKLAMAGPFENGGEYKGILVFDTATLEEALNLVEEDPAIKSGRLIIELIPWWAAKGTCLP